MLSFKEYVNEKQLDEQSYEIPTTKAKELKSKLEKLGMKVSKADEEGLVIQTSDKGKLSKFLKDNGWDQEDIKSLI